MKKKPSGDGGGGGSDVDGVVSAAAVQFVAWGGAHHRATATNAYSYLCCEADQKPKSKKKTHSINPLM